MKQFDLVTSSIRNTILLFAVILLPSVILLEKIDLFLRNKSISWQMYKNNLTYQS